MTKPLLNINPKNKIVSFWISLFVLGFSLMIEGQKSIADSVDLAMLEESYNFFHQQEVENKTQLIPLNIPLTNDESVVFQRIAQYNMNKTLLSAPIFKSKAKKVDQMFQTKWSISSSQNSIESNENNEEPVHHDFNLKLRSSDSTARVVYEGWVVLKMAYSLLDQGLEVVLKPTQPELPVEIQHTEKLGEKTQKILITFNF